MLTKGQNTNSNSTKKVLRSGRNIASRSTPAKGRSSNGKEPGFSELVKRHQQRKENEASENLDKQCSSNKSVHGDIQEGNSSDQNMLHDSLVEADGLQYEVDPHDDMFGSESESDSDNEIDFDANSDEGECDKSLSDDSEIELADSRRVVQNQQGRQKRPVQQKVRQRKYRNCGRTLTFCLL